MAEEIPARNNVVPYDYGTTDDKKSDYGKAPKFNEDPEEFSWWKTNMYSYIMSLDDELWDILEELWENECRFVLAKTEWMTPLLDVDLSEALGLLSAMYSVCDLQLSIVDFELDSKTVVDSFYGRKSGVSNFSAVINNCRRMLASDLVTSDVRFIRRQANEVTRSFSRVALLHASFYIHIRIPSCISTIIMNEMQ
jgi:hypothetical protein